LPASFSIITAFATTGEKWSDLENATANARLKAELERKGVPHWGMTGYSPRTSHAEEGWATTLSAEDACDWGNRYNQHAVYIVSDGVLRVVLCSSGRGEIVGKMVERLHNTTQPRIKSPST